MPDADWKYDATMFLIRYLVGMVAVPVFFGWEGDIPIIAAVLMGLYICGMDWARCANLNKRTDPHGDVEGGQTRAEHLP